MQRQGEKSTCREETLRVSRWQTPEQRSASVRDDCRQCFPSAQPKAESPAGEEISVSRQDTGNASTLFKAVPFGSALFLTWWELGASRGCPHSIQSSLDSSCQPWL